MLSLVLVLILLSMGVSAQVGIGTTTPHTSAILDVSSTNRGLLIPRMTSAQRNAIPAIAGLMVYDTEFKEHFHFDGTQWRRLLNSSYWFRSSSGAWLYNTSDSIGIGTISPDQKLHISSGNIYLQDNRTGKSPHLIFDAPAVDYKEGGLQWIRTGDTLAAVDYVANPSFNNYLKFSVGNSGRNPDLILNSIGNLGMGTADPQVLMHLRQGDATEMLRLDATNPMIQFRRRMGSQIYTWEDVGFIQTSDFNFRIGLNSSNTTGKFVIRTHGADQVFVDNTGMSIATTASAPGYRLRVGGKMICEEVLIKLEANWPDYVFEKNYRLPSFAELREYITENKHLPGIPSAAQVASEGVSVGDMQKRMMEKIEELTLYILDLEKQVRELKQNQK